MKNDIERINVLLEEMGLKCLRKDSYTVTELSMLEFILKDSTLDDKENMQLFDDGCLKLAASFIDDCDKYVGKAEDENSAMDLFDMFRYEGVRSFREEDREKIVFLGMLSEEIKKEILIFKYSNKERLTTMFFDITKLLNAVFQKTGFQRFNYSDEVKLSAYLDVSFVNPFFGEENGIRKIKSI